MKGVLELKYSESDAVRWLTQANPVDSATQLTTTAERDRLISLTATTAREGRTAPTRRPRFVLLGAGLFGLFVAMAVILPTLFAPQPAQALTPRPLAFEDVALESQDMLNTLRNRLLPSAAGAQPQTEAEYLGWFTDIRPDDPVPSAVVIAPQNVHVRWAFDGSGEQTIRAAASYWADPEDTSSLPDAPPAGTILDEQTFATGEFGTPFVEPFGDSVDEVYRALTSVGLPERPAAADIIDATDALMSLWTLTPNQHAAILTLLSETSDARLLGVATDRLGRQIVGFAADSAQYPGTQRIILIEEASGLIVGVEVSRTTDQFPLQAGAVVSYKLWAGAQ